MTLINFWTRDLTAHIARIAGTTKRRAHTLPPVHDLEFTAIRGRVTVDAVVITTTELPAALGDSRLMRALVTIEDEDEFAFTIDTAHWRDGHVEIIAIPLTDYMRHATLPDWYVPDARFCK